MQAVTAPTVSNIYKKRSCFFIHHAQATKRLHVIYETKSIFEISLHAVCPTPAFDSLAPSLTLALMRRPCDAIGRLPRLVVVERSTALAVVAGCVVSAHTLPMDLPGKQHKRIIILILFRMYIGT